MERVRPAVKLPASAVVMLAVCPVRLLIRPALRAASRSQPVDLVLSSEGRTLVVKENRGLVVLDAAPWRIRQEANVVREYG